MCISVGEAEAGTETKERHQACFADDFVGVSGSKFGSGFAGHPGSKFVGDFVGASGSKFGSDFAGHPASKFSSDFVGVSGSKFGSDGRYPGGRLT